MMINWTTEDGVEPGKGTYRDYYCQNCAEKVRMRAENEDDTVFAVCWECTSTLQRWETERPGHAPQRLRPRS